MRKYYKVDFFKEKIFLVTVQFNTNVHLHLRNTNTSWNDTVCVLELLLVLTAKHSNKECSPVVGTYVILNILS